MYQGWYLGAPDDGSDVTPPTITVVSPTPGVEPGQPGGFPADYDTAKDTPIVLEVTDLAPGVAYVALLALTGGSEEVVYRRDAFRGLYATGSSLEVIAGGFRFTVRRVGGWPPGEITWDVDAIDGAGNLAA